MNVLNKFTFENIKKNKKRTIVTIIGVALSTALICAVAGMIMSFQQTLVNTVKMNTGDYHVTFENIDASQLKYVENNQNVDKSTCMYTKSLGYAKLEGSQNDYKPYLYVMAFTNKALQNNGLTLTEGRMPQNENEIVISSHISTNGRVNYKIGDTITLNMGTRESTSDIINKELMDNNIELTQSKSYGYKIDDSQSNKRITTSSKGDSKGDANEDSKIEKIVNTTTKTYKIVGVIERPGDLIEPYTAPGYTVITYLNDNEIISNEQNNNSSEKYNISVRYNKAKNFESVTEKIEETIETNTGKIIQTDNNKSLLEYEGALSENIMKTLYSIGAIVIGIIVISSIFVIRNSFSISISEKTKQYGMLASIGATAKQIKKSVLFEGLIIGIIAIPLGIVCGIIAIFILVKLLNILLADMLQGKIEFVYAIPMSVVGITIIMSAVTIYLSSIIPARRAAKISPIDAIRGADDIKIKAKKVKTSKITKKIFGIGGVIASKNLKRSKKKYRTTVISLVVSITIFIVLSSFLEYGKKMTGVYYKSLSYNVSVFGGNEKIYKEIIADKSIEDYSYSYSRSGKIDIGKYGTDFGKKINSDSSETKVEETANGETVETQKSENATSNIEIILLNNTYFEKFAKRLGITTTDYNKVAIIEDEFIEYKTDKTKAIQNIYNVNSNQELEVSIYKELDQNKNYSKDYKQERENQTIKITMRTDKRPMGFEQNYSDGGFIFVSEDYFGTSQKSNYHINSLYVNSSEPLKLETDLTDLKKSDESYKNIGIENIDKYAKQQDRMILVISIFLYGFIIVITLIGVTNIFNTITTNMILRSKEFAMLKSIGMTSKEFNKMIRLESFMYGIKSLLVGIPLGLLGSYGIYKSFANDFDFGYAVPGLAILISIVFVFIIVGLTMKYSLNKINKQNIVETIRNDNI